MAAIDDTKLLEEHLQRWRTLLLQPIGATNRQMAEDAVNRLYSRVKGAKPEIFWCQSPYQMAIIPTTVAFVRGSREWKDLVKRLQSTGEVGCEAWKAQWRIEWRAFTVGGAWSLTANL